MRRGSQGLKDTRRADPLPPMSRDSPAFGQATDAASDARAGEARWSWRLFGLMAAAWILYGLGLYISGQAEGSTTPWATDLIWRGSNALLWLALTPAIFLLTRAFPVPSDHGLRNAAIHGLAAVVFALAHLAIFLPVNHRLNPDFPRPLPFVRGVLREPDCLPDGHRGDHLRRAVLRVRVQRPLSKGRARAETLRVEELRRQLAEAQLQALRMQIQPHFLFNTLHSIASLIHEAPSEALTMVSRLGDFLRAALERGILPAQSLRLEDELKFAELYLDIQRIRFGDRLSVAIEVAPEVLGCEAPSLILQPLVENAIRHGVAPALGAVDLVIAARQQAGMLEVTLRNAERDPGPMATANGATAAPLTEGLGLSNTRERLARAYGNRASLSVERPKPGAFQVTVRLPMLEAGHGGG